MRSTVDIDERLLREAMAVSNFTTKKELINAGLEELIRAKRIGRLIRRLGKASLRLSLRDLNRMRKHG